MGLLSGLFGGGSRDFSDGAFCPVCNGKCYWNEDKSTWICENCSYEVRAGQVEYDKQTDSVNVLGIDWYCDECDAYLNSQSGFNPYDDRWICTECGHDNDITKNNVL